MHRPPRLAGAAMMAGTLLGGTLLAGCSGSGDALAQQACRQVATSLGLWHRSQTESPPAKASRDRAVALLELRMALPSAALAATRSGQWQALSFTLSESSRVPESDLVTALTQECAVALAPAGQPPPANLPVQPPSS